MGDLEWRFVNIVKCIAGILPTCCQDLQTMDEWLLDDYFRFRVISPADGSTIGEVTLYCVMSTTPAKSYLPLPAGRATNYATTDWRLAYNQKRCGWSFGTNAYYGRTEFDMINVIHVICVIMANYSWCEIVKSTQSSVMSVDRHPRSVAIANITCFLFWSSAHSTPFTSAALF